MWETLHLTIFGDYCKYLSTPFSRWDLNIDHSLEKFPIVFGVHLYPRISHIERGGILHLFIP
jgi:hypothetical protein